MIEKRNNQLDTSDREIVAARLFNAPRELVWNVWTDPKHIANWWGPNGFTNTIHSMDVRPGGVWSFIMHGPDGIDYKNKITYIEIVKPERLVYDHGSGPKFRVTVTFGDEGEKTKLSMRMVFQTAAERDQTVKTFNAVEGLNQTFSRLRDYLSQI